MNVPWFCLGLTAGIVSSSLLWVLYISYFIEEAESLGRRMRRWLLAQLNRLPWRK
jgi:hypothetical protein